MKYINFILENTPEVPDYGWFYKVSAFFLVVICLAPWIVLIFMYIFKRYRVRFYGIHGEVISDKKYKKGAEIILPEDVEVSGYKFDGWYEDPECIYPLSFNYMGTDNVKIYGKWEKIDSEEV